MPKLQQSTSLPWGTPFNISGAAYCGVPQAVVSECPTTPLAAKPKSISCMPLVSSSVSKIIFSGLISRCTTLKVRTGAGVAMD